RISRSTWGSSCMVDPSRIIGSLYRAGLVARYAEQTLQLATPSRRGFGPARGPVQNKCQHINMFWFEIKWFR
ncbi:hypothetical protein A2U01_0075661, partial [Trifolium medium]|nr:hypothetical protein [Trifolium medium]